MTEKIYWESWNGNIRHPYINYFEPQTENEIAALVRESPASIRIIGTGRSSADITAGTDTLISLRKYKQVVHVNIEKYQITVESGILLSELLEELEKLNWSLTALPDIDCISVGGALSTGTHGTGRDAHLLSGYMVGCRLITASGEIHEFNDQNEYMEAVRVSVGLLGVLSTVTFQCEPIFYLNLLERPMRDKDWLIAYRHMLKNHDFLRILWLPHTGFGYVITGDRCLKQKQQEPVLGPSFIKYRRAVSAMLYRWTGRLPLLTVVANKILFNLFFRWHCKSAGSLYNTTVTKSRGSTLELSEWTIALERFEAVFSDLQDELNSLKNRSFVHIPMDIRFIRADNTWLSYGYDCDTVTIGCVCRRAEDADRYAAFEAVQRIFFRHGGRPHWAKRHTLSTEELRSIYPRWDDFIALRRKMDPEGKFLSPSLKNIFG
ncbi:MAG TPA: D-arabinono-1,4-lactone oxidase [Pontiella sp.]